MGFAKQFEDYKSKVVKKGTAGLAIALASAVFTTEIFHFIEIPGWGEKAFFSAITLVGLGVVFQVFQIASNTEDVAEELSRVKKRLELVEGNVTQLVENFSPGLIQLTDCVNALKKDAERQGPIANLVVDWLGLDMMRSWSYVKDVVLSNPNITKSHLRVLMIAPKWSHDPPWVPSDVQDWRENSARMLLKIRDWFENDLPEIRASGREVRIEIRLYDRLPIVHGFRVKEPLRVWYMSFCRWTGKGYKAYDWGEKSYRKITVDHLTPTSRDLVEIFNGQFEHLWESSSEFKIQ